MQSASELKTTQLPGAVPAAYAIVAAEDLHGVCDRARSQGARLVALWGCDDSDGGEGFSLHIALLTRTGLLLLRVPLAADHPRYPSIADLYPAALRMQRATYDLLGIHAQEAPDSRKWLRHGAWPGGTFPLRRAVSIDATFDASGDGYPFVHVEGEGVHEIPVGPVHAGTIEPGHFRFSIVGEAVLRLEERLGYKHKGIEKLAQGMSVAASSRLAARVSGDSTVAYAWAHAQAAESIGGVEPPARAVWMRAIALELERLHNHLGDLGYLGNDVALSFGFFQFWRLKEMVLRVNADLFGHRYLMDLVIPGGVARDLPAEGPQRLFELCGVVDSEMKKLRAIYDEHAGVQDRFTGAGQVAPALAQSMGMTGMAARASGLAADLRVDHPCAPYDRLDVRMATSPAGDVAARVAVRFDEALESMRLIRVLLGQAMAGPVQIEVPMTSGFGIGMVEGWRGEVFVALELDAMGKIRRFHPHDPSWQNWPLLERAVLDNIVPDFPLINKSFNLSYAGHDL